MVLPYRRYAQFGGRSGRREFWWYSLLLFLTYLAAGAILFALVAVEAEDEAVGIAAVSTLGMIFLLNFIPGIALTSRRLHDIGLPGWLVIAAIFAVLFLSIIGWIGYMIVMSLPPRNGENQYGPPVYGEDVADIFS